MEIDFYDVHKYLLDSFRLQVMLGLSGVILVMLSIIGSVGFFSVLGIKSTLIIMEVIPFLVLAVSFLLLTKLSNDGY